MNRIDYFPVIKTTLVSNNSRDDNEDHVFQNIHELLGFIRDNEEVEFLSIVQSENIQRQFFATVYNYDAIRQISFNKFNYMFEKISFDLRERLIHLVSQYTINNESDLKLVNEEIIVAYIDQLPIKIHIDSSSTRRNDWVHVGPVEKHNFDKADLIRIFLMKNGIEAYSQKYKKSEFGHEPYRTLN